jgi:hypothetical protein
MRKIQLVLCFICVTAVVLAYETSPQQKESSGEKVNRKEEFLTSPGVATCDLDETTISTMDFPSRGLPSFIHRMKRNKEKHLRLGKITCANRKFKILLGKNPKQQFCLYDVEKQYAPYWWGSWNLHSKHKIDDKFYEFMIYDEGKKLAVRPYAGKLGILKIGKGGRDLDKAEFKGSLRSDGFSVPVGNIEEHWPKPAAECTIPVGDYTPSIIGVTYDNLKISVSDNYFSNAQGQPKGKKNTVYGITIRQNKPYVLDFSNKPVIIFDQPKPDKTRFKAGEKIKFAAVLVDPKLDIMIRGLDDTTIEIEKTYKVSGGKTSTHKVPKSLDPKIVITQPDGKIVAEGTMPFG